MGTMTLGQYYPADSILHRLDPRVKLLGSVVYLIGLFINNLWIAYLVGAVFLLLMIFLSKVPFHLIFRSIRGIFALLLFTTFFNVFFTPGEILWQWGFFRLTKEGIVVATMMLVRLVMLVMGTSMMTLTTTPNQLTDGLEKSLGGLRKIGVPVHEIAMMMAIALRFIPILSSEMNKIIAAQKARGADFETGNLWKRVKSYIPVLVPLFISAFRRAGDLALAMEARCYRGGEGRTKMKPLIYRPRDFVAYGILALYIGMMLLIKWRW